MKIVYVISNLKKCGPVFVLYDLVKELSKNKGLDIYIITLSSETSLSMLDEFKYLGVKIFSLENISRFNFYKYQKKIKEVLVSVRPDLLHAFCFRSTLLISSIKYFKKYVTVHNYFNFDFKYRHGKLLGFVMERLFLSSIKKYNKVICVSNSLKEYLDKKYNLTNTFAVYNSVERYTTKTNIIDHSSEITFIMVDELTELKNNEFAIQSFVNVFGNQHRYRLKIFGVGKDFIELKNKYSKYSNIVFIGFVEDKDKIFNNAHYYISASRTESFHLSFVEALVNNIYCIVSEIPIHNEIKQLYVNSCETFDLRENDGLINLLKKIKNKNKLEIGNTNFFKCEEMAIKYLSLYSQ
jgi:glycosyltransferase involved in cell wall biosynthesis